MNTTRTIRSTRSDVPQNDTHKVSRLIERPTGVGSSVVEGEARVVEAFLEPAALDEGAAVVTTPDVVVGIRTREDKSECRGGENEGSVERRGEREHGA